MAVQGKTINWSNYIGAVPTSGAWKEVYTTGNTSAAMYPTIYVYAPVFDAQAGADGSGLWGWQYAALTIYYLNSSGGWTQVWSRSCEARGAGVSDGVSWSHTYRGGSSGDVPDIHTWKVVGDIHGDGKGKIRIIVKGIEGRENESRYNTYCKPSSGPKLIKGISGGASTSSYETTASRRGTLITEASGNYKWICN